MCARCSRQGLARQHQPQPWGLVGARATLDNSTAGFEVAVAAAAADQVVLFLGIDGTVEGEATIGIPSGFLFLFFYNLPDGQLELAKAILAKCAAGPTPKPVVVMLINGGQLGIDWLSANAPLATPPRSLRPGTPVFTAATPSPRLYGDSNRWGKYPVTIYGADVLNEVDMLSFDMSSGVARSYRYYNGRNVL